MSNTPAYFRARLMAFAEARSYENTLPFGRERNMRIAFLRNGFIPDSFFRDADQTHYNYKIEPTGTSSTSKSKSQKIFWWPSIPIRINELMPTVDGSPLNPLEIHTLDTWFAMHPHKICGVQKGGSGFSFPVRTIGSKQDIIDTINKTLATTPKKQTTPPKTAIFKFKAKAIKIKMLMDGSILHGVSMKEIKTKLSKFFDLSKLMDINHNCTETEYNNLKNQIENYLKQVTFEPNLSIVKDCTTQEIEIINKVWLAWEINNVTPHGYKTNSCYRSAFFEFKDRFITEAIKMLDKTKTSNIIVKRQNNVIYFFIKNRQVSFHVILKDVYENIKNEAVSWIGVRTAINPLTIDDKTYSQMEQYVSAERVADYIIMPNVFYKHIDTKKLLNYCNAEEVKTKQKHSVDNIYKNPYRVGYEKECSNNFYISDTFFARKYDVSAKGIEFLNKITQNILKSTNNLPSLHNISTPNLFKVNPIRRIYIGYEKALDNAYNWYSNEVENIKKELKKNNERILTIKSKKAKSRLLLENENEILKKYLNFLENSNINAIVKKEIDKAYKIYLKEKAVAEREVVASNEFFCFLLKVYSNIVDIKSPPIYDLTQ